MSDEFDIQEENDRANTATVLRTREVRGIWSRLTAYIGSQDKLVLFEHALGEGASLVGDESESWTRVAAEDVPTVDRLLRARLGDAPLESTVPELMRLAWDRGLFTGSHEWSDWLSENGEMSAYSKLALSEPWWGAKRLPRPPGP